MSKLHDVIQKAQGIENHMDSWTPAEKEISKSKYGCEILMENASYDSVCTKNAPRDAYIVKYEVDGKVCYDLTRCLKKSSLFDMYWDKFGSNLKDIDFGYGSILPKLWGYQAPKSKKGRKS